MRWLVRTGIFPKSVPAYRPRVKDLNPSVFNHQPEHFFSEPVINQLHEPKISSRAKRLIGSSRCNASPEHAQSDLRFDLVNTYT